MSSAKNVNPNPQRNAKLDPVKLFNAAAAQNVNDKAKVTPTPPAQSKASAQGGPAPSVPQMGASPKPKQNREKLNPTMPSVLIENGLVK